MQALFLGQTYVDVTFLTDRIPVGDEKHVASAYAVSFGGNAVTAAFCCAKLGIPPDVVTTVADDWLGRMFLDMAARYRIPIHARKVRTSSLSFIMPNNGKRAIVRCRDDDYCTPSPFCISKAAGASLGRPPAGCRNSLREALPDANILTSLDGGGLRSNTHELLSHIDVAIVAERLCQQMGHQPLAMLDYLKGRGCRVGGVTLGERGLVWYDGTGPVRILPALAVPSDRVIDTNGAGDVFHGAYIYSYLTNTAKGWEDHFRFARAAAAYEIQHLGNEAGLPTLSDIAAVEMEFASFG